jgi:hypothetical protein
MMDFIELVAKGFDFSSPAPYSIGIERMTGCLSGSEISQNQVLVHEEDVFRLLLLQGER